MTQYRRLVVTMLVCSLVSASVGCTSMKTIRPLSPARQESTFRGLKAGDTVWVRTTTGHTAQFVIRQVEADTIIALDGVRYDSAGIVELKRRSFSGPRTAGLAAGIFGGLCLLIAAAAAAALGGIMGGGG